MASYQWMNPPLAEQTQDRLFNDPWTGWSTWDIGHRRSAPAELPYREYDPRLGGWWQGERRLKNFRPDYYYTRPCDGKRRGTMGRLKDALTSEGPDVFITMSGDRRTLMKDRPQRWQWTGWGMNMAQQVAWMHDRDWRAQDGMDVLNGNPPPGYNFRKRRYEAPKMKNWQNDRLWTDAHWQDGARRHARIPSSKRYLSGAQATRVPLNSGFYAGGRPLWR
ncbi:hypothetical protein LTR53_009967 [Teratosphaeriaceae sp. CCFEE 6253]|nr:hypothetical protein LTR53_009967 [Teratosphaeriaceae sp. CCFEE 6253]